MINITATSFWINLKVTFFKSLFPINAPAIAASVAQITNKMFSPNPDLIKREAYTDSRVKSTNVETTVAVAINASFDKPDLIRKAVRRAPWLPDKPPKNPLKAPPIASLSFPNCNLLK